MRMRNERRSCAAEREEAGGRQTDSGVPCSLVVWPGDLHIRAFSRALALLSSFIGWILCWDWWKWRPRGGMERSAPLQCRDMRYICTHAMYYNLKVDRESGIPSVDSGFYYGAFTLCWSLKGTTMDENFLKRQLRYAWAFQQPNSFKGRWRPVAVCSVAVCDVNVAVDSSTFAVFCAVSTNCFYPVGAGRFRDLSDVLILTPLGKKSRTRKRSLF